ncbi:unnamed protein product [Linum tenue]|uniref:AT-hook motif nuclear-localized protein n=1 Tax=Linum tenue TaxID=586396 RepID=A0AAV0PG03_9ROSI|nr:unnamed protein product [Linum tenue]
MEEKESTVSGSLGNSDTDSPPPVTSLHPQPPPHHHHSQPVVPSNDAFGGALVERSTVPLAGDYLVKKKRGRPRKYDADGNLRVKPFHHHQHNNNGNNNNSVLSSATSPPQQQPTTMFSFSPSSPPSTDQHHYQQQRSYPPAKRGRGRHAASGNWQLLASLGGDFTPHVVTVNTGEDVGGKILSLSQKGYRGICVLSANGTVSNVTIRQPGSSGGILTYEASSLANLNDLSNGRFEILSLTGSFTVSENGGKTRTGGLSVSLASSDGRVIGGGVAGLLLAATPIQMVVGTFMPNGYKVQKRKYTHRDQQHYSLPQPATSQTAPQPTAIPQQAAKCEAAADAPPTSLPGQSHHVTAAAAAAAADNYNVNDGRQFWFHGNNSSNHNSNHSYNHERPDSGWNNGTTMAMNSGIHRPSPDINVSAASDEDVPPGVF